MENKYLVGLMFKCCELYKLYFSPPAGGFTRKEIKKLEKKLGHRLRPVAFTVFSNQFFFGWGYRAVHRVRSLRQKKVCLCRSTVGFHFHIYPNCFLGGIESSSSCEEP